MLGQILDFLADTLITFFVVLLVARFLLQWLRVSFRNPLGEFVVVTTNWLVRPARRVVPGWGGLDLATLLLAWLLQGAALWIHAAIAGAHIAAAALIAVAFVDLLRFAIYILVFAVIMQVVFSWVNPQAPLAPVFDAITRPFLRPLRRIVPPIANVDLSPAVLFLLLQVALIVWRYLAAAAASIA